MKPYLSNLCLTPPQGLSQQIRLENAENKLSLVLGKYE